MRKTRFRGVGSWKQAWSWMALFVLALLVVGPSTRATAQDQDDPPGRVARLGYMEGSVSFEPAGENDWVEAVPNRPMTTGDKLWADRDSRAEVQLGSATLDLAPNTGFSFLNLDDRTVQIQLSAGSLNVRVWDLDRDNVFEIDTPNQAFTVYRPGRYRLDAAEDGNYTVVTIREGEGESTGNGQSYTMHAGQRFTFSGTTALNAEVEQIGAPDDFDSWSDRRERRYQDSPSARYCSRRVVGFEDLDDYGDWRPTPEYGYAWFPRVDAGWAPYHEGHWAWIDPWGWTWVDDDRWGYAPFHYGRWVFTFGRWGWIPGPVEERPVYAPALVAFVGGGFAMGGTVAWFPLGPREVYVPSYRVSPAYVNRVNISNTTVNTTTITNVYNTTIVNNNTTLNNVTYVNRNVQGAVTAVPQRAFATAQPVARAAVPVNTRQLATVPVTARAAVPPAREAVLGARANTANRVAAPPQAVASRPVIAKAAPPPPSPSFAARQSVLAQHPGVPVPRPELQKMRPANAPAAPLVKQAPPAKPATPQPAMNRPAGQPPQPGSPAVNRPSATPPPTPQPAPANQPGANNRPQPAAPTPPPERTERPFTPPNRPQPAQPAPNNPPQPSPPAPPPSRSDRPPSAQPSNRPEPTPSPANRPQPTPNQPPPGNRPEPNRPEPNRQPPPPQTERPAAAPPNYRRQPNQEPSNNRPEQARPDQARPNEPPPQTGRPPVDQPNNRYSEQPPNRPENRPATPPNQRPEQQPPAQAKPAPPPQRPQPKPSPDEKKRQEEQKKQDQKPQ